MGESCALAEGYFSGDLHGPVKTRMALKPDISANLNPETCERHGVTGDASDDLF